MLPIACAALSCLQMTLGTGYIVSQSSGGFIYRNMERNSYSYCQGASGYYNCRVLTGPMARQLDDQRYGLYQ